MDYYRKALAYFDLLKNNIFTKDPNELTLEELLKAPELIDQVQRAQEKALTALLAHRHANEKAAVRLGQ